ncbi:MAG TPA: hypothetical protein VLV56_17870 [Burkholderiales bacterium]|nr:hypothetical protein [Burkholderiales bacterium]
MRKLAAWIWPLLFATPLAAYAADEVNKEPAPVSAGTPQHRLLNDSFRFSLGGFRAESTTEARLSPQPGGAGVDVNFEDMLGLDKIRLIAEASMYWRFAERWRVDLGYWNLNRHGTRTLDTDVEWGGNTYPLGTTVDSKYRISDLRAAVGYSFFRRSDKELGVGFGLHRAGIETSLDAAGIGAANQNVTAPLPFFMLYGNFALTDTWALSLRSDWLSLSYDKYSGGIRATAVDFVYQPFAHWAFGFGVHSLTVKLDVNNPSSKLETRLVFQGPAAFASFSY